MTHSHTRKDPMKKPFIISKYIMDLLMEQKHFSDLHTLYSIYCYTALWQNTNRPKCTTGYTAKKIKWCTKKVIDRKRELIELGLVKDVFQKNVKGKGTKFFIKVNFLWTQDMIDQLNVCTDNKESEIMIEGVSKSNPSVTCLTLVTTDNNKTKGGLENLTGGVNNSNPLLEKEENLKKVSKSNPYTLREEHKKQDKENNKEKSLLQKEKEKVVSIEQGNLSDSDKKNILVEEAKQIPLPVKVTGYIEPEHFEIIWELYPRQVARHAAEKIWNTLCKLPMKSKVGESKPLLKTVKKAIFKQTPKLKERGLDYIPYLRSWLTDRSWVDNTQHIIDKSKKPNPISFASDADLDYRPADDQI